MQQHITVSNIAIFQAELNVPRVSVHVRERRDNVCQCINLDYIRNSAPRLTYAPHVFQVVSHKTVALKFCAQIVARTQLTRDYFQHSHDFATELSLFVKILLVLPSSENTTRVLSVRCLDLSYCSISSSLSITYWHRKFTVGNKVRWAV